MKRSLSMVSACLSALLLVAPVEAQYGGGGGGGGFGGGGVHIDPDGVIRIGSPRKRPGKRPAAPNLSAELAARSDLRKVSLRRLDEQARAALDAGTPISNDVRLMAGLVKVEYVIFDRDNRDVLVAGPAEGCKIARDGRVVGVTSNRPMLRLEDLACALRNVLTGPGNVSCSIDLQARGLAALARATPDRPLPTSRREARAAREKVARLIDVQTVRTGGVPDGSRFALVMIEADYLMKRVAMGLRKTPGIKTHLDSLVALTDQGVGRPNLVRWWFTPSYEPFLTNEERTIFKLRGQALKLLNEEEFVDANGRRRGTGQPSAADEFSESFTDRLPKLEAKMAPFADLHNLFDLMMVAGLIRKQGAGDWLADSALLDPARFEIPTTDQPRFAEPVVTIDFERSKKKLRFVYAYGGVSIEPGRVGALTNPQVDAGGELASLAPALGASLPALPATESDSTSGNDSGREADQSARGDRDLGPARSLVRWWTDVKLADSDK